MDFFSQVSVALRGETGAPQSAAETIGKLSDRLIPSTLLADRRAAVQALKGLSRDCRADVGDKALPGLLQVLENDAEVDPDIGKAALETLHSLCDVEDGSHASKELAFKYTDQVLATEKPIHTLFTLLANNNFYLRFSSLQFLSILLQSRRQVVQGYFLKAQNGSSCIMSVLEDKREMIRNEAINIVQSLTSQSSDIQKILAFEGAFEKLFNTVTQENGVEGGVATQEALTCVDSLLRFNSSNQSYFRETSLPPLLGRLLLFPPSEQNPTEFALQFWDDQKLKNCMLVVGIMGMLIGSKGSGSQDSENFIRCLVELGLSSNAPTKLKTQSLRLLPANFNFPLSEVFITPYMPVPETNGEEWDRLEPCSTLDALVELALHGEYNGLDANSRSKDSLELRTAAVSVFENFVRKEEIRQAIVQAMLPPEGSSEAPPITPLLHALAVPPSSSALDPTSITTTQIAALLFSHLLRGSPHAKTLARSIKPGPLHPPSSDQAQGEGGNFFVPADGKAPPPAPEPETKEPEDDDDDEPPQALLQILSENLSLAFLSRSRANTSDRESREWDRLVVVYLCLLSQWLWEDAGAVREFLNAGGMGLLVDPINQSSDLDSVVPGLCALLLGICYEFNREPGEITRHTIHPILNRLGVETLLGRMARLREDERFKAVGPESIVLPYPTPHLQVSSIKKEIEDEAEVWFDWPFVDFWKSNYYTIQRGFAAEPDHLSSSSSQSAEATMLITTLQDSIRRQSEEIAALKDELARKEKAPPPPPPPAPESQVVNTGAEEIASLKSELATLKSLLEESEMKRKDTEKEQEDLLVLLDEVNGKRRADKEKMKGAGLDVSEDEAEDGEEGDDDVD